MSSRTPRSPKGTSLPPMPPPEPPVSCWELESLPPSAHHCLSSTDRGMSWLSHKSCDENPEERLTPPKSPTRNPLAHKVGCESQNASSFRATSPQNVQRMSNPESSHNTTSRFVSSLPDLDEMIVPTGSAFRTIATTSILPSRGPPPSPNMLRGCQSPLIWEMPASSSQGSTVTLPKVSSNSWLSDVYCLFAGFSLPEVSWNV